MRYLALTLIAGLSLSACDNGSSYQQSSSSRSIEKPREADPNLPTTYENKPEWSLTLLDQKIEGTVSERYYHKYKWVYGDYAAPKAALDTGGAAASSAQAETAASRTTSKDCKNLDYQSVETDWILVSKKTHDAHADDLGMTLKSKLCGQAPNKRIKPAGYQYLGDPQYGRWQNNSAGTSFWVWYGAYRIFGDVFDTFRYRSARRSDWNMYNNYSSRGATYYGPNNRYGTWGSQAKRTNPDFFARGQQRYAARRTSFQAKVNNRSRSNFGSSNRIGRSNMSPTRSRSGGFGK